MPVSAVNIDVGSVLNGAGSFLKDLRTAITGEAPIDATKRAELLLRAQEIETALSQAQIQVIIAESQSLDKWTSRGRPMFLYVMYIMILASIPMGVVYSVSPATAGAIVTGFKSWLASIPDSLYVLFGSGYLGYGAFRSFDKKLRTNGKG
jgi:hypothetical protein